MKIFTSKINFLLLIFTIFVQFNYAQNVGINSSGANADPSAAVDISASNKGLLIPRVSLTSTSDVSTISSPATSLLVYNTATSSDVTPGYYFWDGAKWNAFGTSVKKSITINAFSVGYGGTPSNSRSVYVNGNLVSTSGRAVHLTVLSGNNGSVIFSQTYDTYANISNGDALATDLTTYNTAGNILIINTYDEPSKLSANLKTALKDIMRSTKIAYQTLDSRCSWCIVYQNGKGKLAEDLSNAYDDAGNVIGNGNTIRSIASCNVATYVGW